MMPIRRIAWKNLKQAKEWGCVISAPAGQVHFVCPECRAQTQILKVGAFDCPQCQTSFVAGGGALSATYHRYIVHRVLPNDCEQVQAQG